MRVVLKTLNEDSDKHDELFLELLSSADQMIEYFDNKKFDYYMLLHTDDTNLEDFLTGLKTATNTSQSIPRFLQYCTPHEQQELFKYCLDHSDEIEITSSQHSILFLYKHDQHPVAYTREISRNIPISTWPYVRENVRFCLVPN